MDISIVTINYNSHGETIRLVDSLRTKIVGIVYEIIVVDNASDKNDLSLLENHLLSLENVRLIKNKFNAGFGGGNNLGFTFSKDSDYTLFINNVCYIDENFMDKLLNRFEANPDFALAGVQILADDGSKSKSHFPFHGLAIQLMGLKMYGKFFLKNKHLDTVMRHVDCVSGSFMFFRNTDFIKINGFDDNIFLFYEEMDISKRLRKLGKKVVFMSDINCFHSAGVSVSKSTVTNLWKEKELLISYSYVFRKHFGGFLWTLLYLLKSLKYLLQSILRPKVFSLFLFWVCVPRLTDSSKFKSHG